MKKANFIFLILPLFLFIVTSCGKDDDSTGDSSNYECQTCMDVPLAKAAYDNNSGGIYKGIVTGSSGTILFDINNGGSEVTATMTLDGETINLVSSVTWSDGESYVAPFTGTYNGATISITFSVGAAGDQPSIIASDIPGHPNARFVLAKETSTMLIESFEGTYSTTEPEEGTFNILLSRDLAQWGGTHKENGSNEPEDMSGIITPSNKLIEDDGGSEIGTLSGDEINGKFTDGDGIKITVHGERTL